MDLENLGKLDEKAIEMVTPNFKRVSMLEFHPYLPLSVNIPVVYTESYAWGFWNLYSNNIY